MRGRRQGLVARGDGTYTWAASLIVKGRTRTAYKRSDAAAIEWKWQRLRLDTDLRR